MCFYDQIGFECGDYKWGQFRSHCAKEYRTGETCGMKLVYESSHIRQKCRICEKIDIKWNKLNKEKANIERWRKESGRKASIEKARENVAQYERDIANLQQEKADKRNRL